jgi:MoaA/NifB/PqqE/SkfB family radical SAM enzyme
MVLDGHKLAWHMDRVQAWERGERIAPITIDMALTRACDAACGFCYAQMQENDRQEITEGVIDAFLEDSARMGVRGISLVSDGESLVSPIYGHTITQGYSLGLSMASGTNGFRFTESLLSQVLPCLSYLRFNISGGTQQRYCQIMGVKPSFWERVISNVRAAVRIKQERNLSVTLGIQMVLMPKDSDQILPFAELGKELGVDYAVIKHCSDDEYRTLGIKYQEYNELHDLLRQAESLSTDRYRVAVKWNKIRDAETETNARSYQRCYGPPFLIQMSGSGLVAPCGMLFNDRYAKFHIGNICEQRWWDIWQSDRYWEVMHYLASDQFDAQRMCGALCIQHLANTALDRHMKGIESLRKAESPAPLHIDFL